jgi:predicted nuclease of predicted toxin-antitoxin system
MRIKVDEDLPGQVVHLLRASGYDASSVTEQGMGGWKDPELWQAVQREKRFLITADKGFGDIRQYPPGTHAGVLVLRPDQDGIEPVLRLLQQVLSTGSLKAFSGALVVATPRGLRIRR